MKKYTGNFTTDAGKALKNSERLFCCTDKDGAIYVTNGFTAYKMNPLEYSAIVHPVSCCEAGNWSMRNGEKTEEPPFDLVRTFRDAVTACETAAALERCPLSLTVDKNRAAAVYYNADKDFTALYDTRYISALAPGFTLRSTGDKSPAIAYQDGEPFALILPIRGDDKTARAVKAYFTQPGNSADEAEALRAELASLRDKLTAAETGAAALAERVTRQADEIAALRSAADNSAQQAAEPQPAPVEPKTAAELIAARFSGLPGVTVTIKGAQTSAPVVWLTGDTDPHADELNAAGAKWSNKKSAFYVRVA